MNTECSELIVEQLEGTSDMDRITTYDALIYTAKYLPEVYNSEDMELIARTVLKYRDEFTRPVYAAKYSALVSHTHDILTSVDKSDHTKISIFSLGAAIFLSASMRDKLLQMCDNILNGTDPKGTRYRETFNAISALLDLKQIPWEQRAYHRQNAMVIQDRLAKVLRYAVGQQDHDHLEFATYLCKVLCKYYRTHSCEVDPDPKSSETKGFKLLQIAKYMVDHRHCSANDLSRLSI